MEAGQMQNLLESCPTTETWWKRKRHEDYVACAISSLTAEHTRKLPYYGDMMVGKEETQRLPCICCMSVNDFMF